MLPFKGVLPNCWNVAVAVMVCLLCILPAPYVAVGSVFLVLCDSDAAYCCLVPSSVSSHVAFKLTLLMC